MILHTLNALPGSAASTDCIALLAAGDALLLIGDGVYAAMADSPVLPALQHTAAAVYVLYDDAAARGIAAQLWTGAAVVDVAGFVALTEQFPRQQAWY